MPAQTARTRRAHAHPRTRTTPAPRHARRVSGPLRALPAGAAAPVRRGTTGVFERLRALPETRMVDRLLRGRVWIWMVGILLGGIVAMQVSMLKLNTGIGRAVTTTATLERQNAGLEADIARLSSSERARSAAAAKGMIMPPAGANEYLRSHGDRDPNRAARRMTPPSDDAKAIMANGGKEPGVLAAPVVPATDPVTAPVPVTDPAAVDPAAVAPVAATDPAATAPDPAATAPVTDPATGATAAPQG
jgi:hypothetical protein